ncbi:MAG: energy transducer TonB [Candidatus Krumholzibacteria bacterium]|nr:energy transducer TonB [Candidatus Krumholzibacteria bacterium]
MARQKRTKEWVFIIAAAVVLHVVLFVFIKPSFFSAFKKNIASDTQNGVGERLMPMSVLTIPVEIEDYPDIIQQNPVQEDAREPVTEKKKPEKITRLVTDETLRAGSSDESSKSTEIESLVGESPQTLPHNFGPQAVIIPPRALEITWPDTRKLKHCLGHNIDLKIQVDRDGKIARVQALSTGHPADCVRAAVESAKRIVFEPGLINGQPATMWTKVRLDFRRKK